MGRPPHPEDPQSAPPRVVMFVYNSFQHDTRVLREAKALIADGWRVAVVAVQDADSPASEVRAGIEVLRVAKDPVHLRWMREVRERGPAWLALTLLASPAVLAARLLRRRPAHRPRPSRRFGLRLWRVRNLWRRQVRRRAILGVRSARRAARLAGSRAHRLIRQRVRRPLHLLVRRSIGGYRLHVRRPAVHLHRRIRRPYRLWVRRPAGRLARGALRALRRTARRSRSSARRFLYLRYRHLHGRFRLRVRRPLYLLYSRLRSGWRLRVRRPLYLRYRRLQTRFRLRVRRPLYLSYRRLQSRFRLSVRRPLYLLYRRRQARFRLAVGRPFQRRVASLRYSISVIARRVALRSRHRLASGRRRLRARLRRAAVRLQAIVRLRLARPAQRLVARSVAWSRARRRRWTRALRSQGYSLVKTVLMPYHRQFCYLDYYRRAVLAAEGLDAAVYHAHDLNALPVAWWLARRRGSRLVYDSHELYVHRNRLPPLTPPGRWMVRSVERFLIHRVDAAITVGDAIAGHLAAEYGVPRPRVVMNTPPRQSLAPANERSLRSLLPIDPDHRLLLYVGGITFNRGLDKVIRSLRHLPDCHLVLMGYGREEFILALLELARREEVAERVSLFGPVPSEEVSAYAASADLGVAPIENVCLSYYYCSPNKLFEYIHAGLPVVASDFPELARIVAEHEIGELFDPSDPRDIARAVAAVLEDPVRARRMRRNARTVASRYCWDLEAAKLVDLYRGLRVRGAGELPAGAPAADGAPHPEPVEPRFPADRAVRSWGGQLHG